MDSVVINEVLYIQSQTLERKCLDVIDDDERQRFHPPTQLPLNPYKRLVKVHDSKCVHNMCIGIWSLACMQSLNTKYFKYGCTVCSY